MTTLGALLASGASSELFAFGAGRVIKLFRPEYAFLANPEEQRASAVHAAGAASPAVLGRAEIDGRPGIVFEHVLGPTLLAEASPIEEMADALAGAHAALHALTAAALPSWRDVLEGVSAALAPDERAHLRHHVARLPEGDRIYHGDFHPGNVIRGERALVTVDWPNACRAHPAADVARSFVLLAAQGLPADARASTIEGRRRLATRYVRSSLAASGVDRAELSACLPLAAEGVLRAEPTNAVSDELARLAAGETDSAFG